MHLKRPERLVRPDAKDAIFFFPDEDGNVKYLTMWVGFPKEENWTEEPLEHFLGSGEGMIRAFHRKHPNAAKDPRVRLRG